MWDAEKFFRYCIFLGITEYLVFSSKELQKNILRKIWKLKDEYEINIPKV